MLKRLLHLVLKTYRCVLCRAVGKEKGHMHNFVALRVQERSTLGQESGANVYFLRALTGMVLIFAITRQQKDGRCFRCWCLLILAAFTARTWTRTAHSEKDFRVVRTFHLRGVLEVFPQSKQEDQMPAGFQKTMLRISSMPQLLNIARDFKGMFEADLCMCTV